MESQEKPDVKALTQLEFRGPMLAPGCSIVYSTCVKFLDNNKIPTPALANGLWIGEIPDGLKNLMYAEQ